MGQLPNGGLRENHLACGGSLIMSEFGNKEGHHS